MDRKYYKIYYDTSKKAFLAETEPSEIHEIPSDSPTKWFDSLEHAQQAAKSRNKNKEFIIKICKDCKNAFWLGQDEIDWYLDKNLQPPARCQDCRDKRRRT